MQKKSMRPIGRASITGGLHDIDADVVENHLLPFLDDSDGSALSLVSKITQVV